MAVSVAHGFYPLTRIRGVDDAELPRHELHAHAATQVAFEHDAALRIDHHVPTDEGRPRERSAVNAREGRADVT